MNPRPPVMSPTEVVVLSWGGTWPGLLSVPVLLPVALRLMPELMPMRRHGHRPFGSVFYSAAVMEMQSRKRRARN